MGPHSQECGRIDGAGALADQIGSFNGAALSRVRKARWMVAKLVSESSFNGAALSRVRKDRPSQVACGTAVTKRFARGGGNR